MGVEIRGMKELERELNVRYGQSNMNAIIDKALVAGGHKVLAIIKAEQSKYKDTGETVREAKLSEPMWIGGERVVKIHWRGPRDRWRIIHLQESGFYNKDGSFNSPKSKGALQRAMVAGREVYFLTIKKELEKHL